MADISTRMSVSGISQYKSAMQQAAQSVKTLDAQLKQADAEFKATGDKEKYMADKAKLLEDKLKAQKTAAKNAQQALKQMKDQGVDPMSQAYQKMQQQLAQAETGVLETSAAINTLGQSEQEAAKGADQLTASVQGISKKISLQQVIGGIDKITGGLENAAKKAVELGKALWDEVISQAEKADDIATKAMIYGLTSEEYQRMQKVAATIGETSVEAIINAQSRLNYGLGKNSEGTLNALRELRVATKELKDTGGGILEYVDKDAVDIFWEAGEAMMKLTNETEQQAYAQDIFGRGWKELRPLFNMGREEYEKALSEQNVLSDEGIQKLAELHDAYVKYQGDIETLEQKIMTGMAPALTTATNALDGLLTRLLEYLDTPEGQKLLEQMETSISNLFDDLSNINPEDVVNNFIEVFNKLVGALEFISNNWPDIVDGIKAIGIAFGALKIGEGVLEGLRLINGFKNLTGAGGGDPTQTTGTKTGGLNSKIMSGIGAMVVVNWDPSRVREIEKETGSKRDALAKYLDELNGSNLYELQQEWDNNKTKNSGGNFLQQVMDSPKNLAKVIWDALTNKGTAGDWSSADGDDWSVKVKPEAEAGSAEALAEQIGAVTVPVNLQITGFGGTAIGGGAGHGIDPLRQTLFGRMTGFANGLPFVPFDGFPAILHRGERVMPAQENKNYTYNNHNYFGSVNLNNGTQVDQLADAIARQTRKQSAGYGG